MDDDPIIAAALRYRDAHVVEEDGSHDMAAVFAAGQALVDALDARPACWPWRSPDAPPEPDAAQSCWVRWTSEDGKEHVSDCRRVKNNGVPCWWSVDHQWILDEESVSGWQPGGST